MTPLGDNFRLTDQQDNFGTGVVTSTTSPFLVKLKGGEGEISGIENDLAGLANLALSREQATLCSRERLFMLKHALLLIYYILGIGSFFFAQLRAQLATPGKRVELEGGRHLTLYCTGSGSPLVVLEGGYGSDLLTWRRVQPLLTKHNRVCSYDRAGERFSDPSPYPRDLNAMVADLHALASEAHFSKPFILVGHSMGGMTALLYTERYQGLSTCLAKRPSLCVSSIRLYSRAANMRQSRSASNVSAYRN
jgi:hypothetical protein